MIMYMYTCNIIILPFINPLLVDIIEMRTDLLHTRQDTQELREEM